MTSVRDYFHQYIADEKELDAFGEWAFGEDFRELEETMKYLECWNFHHGKDLTLVPTGQISEDAPKMVALWRESKK
jgi:hypothetical protein